jgi:hypothetical protein
MAKALVLPQSVLPPETFGIFASHERTRDVKDDRPLPQQRGEKQEADQTGAGSAPRSGDPAASRAGREFRSAARGLELIHSCDRTYNIEWIRECGKSGTAASNRAAEAARL